MNKFVRNLWNVRVNRCKYLPSRQSTRLKIELLSCVAQYRPSKKINRYTLCKNSINLTDFRIKDI